MQSPIPNPPLTGPAELLKPIVYQQDGQYCALLGIDPEDGVFGCGETVEAALESWDTALREHLSTADEDDYIVDLVKYHLPAPEKYKDPRPDVQAFYDQIRPRRK